MSIVSENLERLRLKNGYTQEQAAQLMGVSRVTYANIESGKSDISVGKLAKAAALYNIPTEELLGQPRNNDKFLQMYFYILHHFHSGIPKTKLAKLLYLADFSWYYDNLEPMSGVRYVRRDYGPVADVFFELTDDLYDKGQIDIEPMEYALMVKPTSSDCDFNLLSDNEKAHLDKICHLWGDRRTSEIVNYTHGQRPWKLCRDGEYIPYELIIQEDPEHVFTPTI